jgi:hypothetical protein
MGYRMMIYRRFERGEGTRNVLIVGTGPEAHALRHHLESMRHRFTSAIDFQRRSSAGGSYAGSDARFAASSGDVVGTMDTLFQNVRKHFVDEIFFTTQCERGIVQDVLAQARTHGVDLRVVPDMYDGLAWNSPIEYIGQFPTIPLHSGHVPEIGLLLKRAMDMAAGSDAAGAVSLLLWSSRMAVKLDSHGPVFILRAHRQEGARLSLHQVPHHGARRGEAPRRRACT